MDKCCKKTLNFFVVLRNICNFVAKMQKEGKVSFF